MPADYGWIILKDELFDGEGRDESQTIGPSDIAPEVEQKLRSGKDCYFFKIYDDDNVHYYTGLGAALTEEATGTEEFCAAPLYDFAMPNAGATRIEWSGHPEWACS